MDGNKPEAETIRIAKNHEHSFWRKRSVKFFHQRGHLPLQIFDQVREPPCFYFPVHKLPEWHGRYADHGSFLRNGTDDAGSGVDHRVVTDGQYKLQVDAPVAIVTAKASAENAK